MDYTSIRYDIDNNGVALITLNRPEVANAANIILCDECSDAFLKASMDQKVKVLVITGAGKAFSAGGDISLILNSQEVEAKAALSESVNRAAMAAYNCPKPLIAAVNGVVGGGGICFALICDLILASERARFACNFLGIAACPDGGASYYLPRKVGYGKAFELLLGNQVISAQEALEIGLVNRVFSEDIFMEGVLEIAQKLAQGPTQAQAHTKWLLKEGLRNSLETQLQLESHAQLIAWSSRDFQEGTRAFFEKRIPSFSSGSKT